MFKNFPFISRQRIYRIMPMSLYVALVISIATCSIAFLLTLILSVMKLAEVGQVATWRWGYCLLPSTIWLGITILAAITPILYWVIFNLCVLIGYPCYLLMGKIRKGLKIEKLRE